MGLYHVSYNLHNAAGTHGPIRIYFGRDPAGDDDAISERFHHIEREGSQDAPSTTLVLHDNENGYPPAAVQAIVTEFLNYANFLGVPPESIKLIVSCIDERVGYYWH